MHLFQSKFIKVAAFVILIGLACVGWAANRAMLPGTADQEESAAETPTTPSTAYVKLVAGEPHTLYVPEDVRAALGIRKAGVDLVAQAHRPTWMRPLTMSGSTMLDPTRILRIRALFAPSPSSPKVVEIGQIKEDPATSGTGQTVMRELRRRPRHQGRSAGGVLQRGRGEQEK